MIGEILKWIGGIAVVGGVLYAGVAFYVGWAFMQAFPASKR